MAQYANIAVMAHATMRNETNHAAAALPMPACVSYLVGRPELAFHDE